MTRLRQASARQARPIRGRMTAEGGGLAVKRRTLSHNNKIPYVLDFSIVGPASSRAYSREKRGHGR